MSKKQGYCEKELQHKGHLFKLAQSKAGKNRTNQGKKRKKKPCLLISYWFSTLGFGNTLSEENEPTREPLWYSADQMLIPCVGGLISRAI